jgi:integrase
MAVLTSADIAAFRDRVEAVNYAQATIVRRLNLIQTIIEHSRREWRINIASNPAQLVKRPAGADHKPNRMLAPANPKNSSEPEADVSRSEEERLLKVCDADANRWLGSIVRFAILTAMRQGEIVGLKWSDIDLRNRTAIVRGATGTVTKNGEIREVPLLPAALSLLEGIRQPERQRVFPIDQNVLRMWYRRAVGRAEIEDLVARNGTTTRFAALNLNNGSVIGRDTQRHRISSICPNPVILICNL